MIVVTRDDGKRIGLDEEDIRMIIPGPTTTIGNNIRPTWQVFTYTRTAPQLNILENPDEVVEMINYGWENVYEPEEIEEDEEDC